MHTPGGTERMRRPPLFVFTIKTQITDRIILLRIGKEREIRIWITIIIWITERN
jgi:hypothetical protein